MVTHWQSSRRPLYVRTVWKDGQHHVILDKSKENPLKTLQSSKTRQCSSSPNSHRSSKSANTAVNLKVSSVRVLLSGVNGFKEAQRSSRVHEPFIDKPRTWIEAGPKRPVTCKDLNKEVTFNAIQGIKPPNLYKSKTVDLECLTIEKTSEPTSEYLLNNALSERVMNWLDLAIQNGHIDTEVKQERAVTAHACQLLEKPRKICEVKDSLDVQQDVIDSSILKNSPRYETEREEMIVFSSEEVNVPDDDFYHVLTPNVGDEGNCDAIVKEKERKVNTAKRQLHIFLPNLRKRSIDCDSSIISSKLSLI